jgi:hypothetical protein
VKHPITSTRHHCKAGIAIIQHHCPRPQVVMAHPVQQPGYRTGDPVGIEFPVSPSDPHRYLLSSAHNGITIHIVPRFHILIRRDRNRSKAGTHDSRLLTFDFQVDTISRMTGRAYWCNCKYKPGEATPATRSL